MRVMALSRGTGSAIRGRVWLSLKLLLHVSRAVPDAFGRGSQMQLTQAFLCGRVAPSAPNCRLLTFSTVRANASHQSPTLPKTARERERERERLRVSHQKWHLKGDVCSADRVVSFL